MKIAIPRLLSYFLILVAIFGCSEDDNINETIASSNGVSGFVQKGPFVSGSNIIVQVLDESFNPTGETFTVTTIDDFGSFVLESEITGAYVEFIAQGFYFNEVSGKISDASLTLRAVAKVGTELKSNINILTTLSKNRIIQLVKQENLSFDEAKRRAETEILSLFNIALLGSFDFNIMDIREHGPQHAVLLAISCVLQGEQSVGELSELISKIILDVQNDGTIDSQSISQTLFANASALNLARVRQNLIERYAQLGLQYVVPEFEKYAKRLVPILVVGTRPVHNATDIAFDAGIDISFNKALAESSVSGSTVRLITSGGSSVPGQVLYDADSFKIEFRPAALLVPTETYRLVIDQQTETFDGTSFENIEFDFTTTSNDIEANLVAWYPLNGDATDETGHGFNATGVNVLFDEGINNAGCKLSGEGSYLEIPNIMNLTEKVWTYSIWFRLDEISEGTNPFLLSTKNSRYSGWDIPLFVGSFYKTVGSRTRVNDLSIAANSVTVDKWYHAAIVVNNGIVELYLNGNLAMRRTYVWSSWPIQTDPDFSGTSTGSYQFYSGKYYVSDPNGPQSASTTPGFLKGSVDNVRFYDRALNKYEIMELFTNNL